MDPNGTFFSANNAHFVLVTESHNNELGINRKNSIEIEFKFIPGNMSEFILYKRKYYIIGFIDSYLS